jgi:hypothetical protein
MPPLVVVVPAQVLTRPVAFQPPRPLARLHVQRDSLNVPGFGCGPVRAATPRTPSRCAPPRPRTSSAARRVATSGGQSDQLAIVPLRPGLGECRVGAARPGSLASNVWPAPTGRRGIWLDQGSAGTRRAAMPRQRPGLGALLVHGTNGSGPTCRALDGCVTAVYRRTCDTTLFQALVSPDRILAVLPAGWRTRHDRVQLARWDGRLALERGTKLLSPGRLQPGRTGLDRR